MTKIADILRAGKANIESKGWCQGDEKALAEEGHPHGFCVATSVTDVTGLDNHTTYNTGIDAMVLFKRANGIDPDLCIGRWNDAPGRTKEEVLAAFDKAIALAEQEGA